GAAGGSPRWRGPAWWPPCRRGGWGTGRASHRRPRSARRTPTTSRNDSAPRAASRRRPIVPALLSFDYAVLRVVPRVEREEFVNAGVVLLCLERHFLGARVELDRARVLALHPDADLPLIDEHLRAVPRIAAGGEGGG